MWYLLILNCFIVTSPDKKGVEYITCHSYIKTDQKYKKFDECQKAGELSGLEISTLNTEKMTYETRRDIPPFACTKNIKKVKAVRVVKKFKFVEDKNDK